MLFIIGILLRLPLFFKSPEPLTKKMDSYLYLSFVEALKPIAVFIPSVYVIIAFLLVFLQAYLLTIFINNNRLMNKANFLPGMAYILVTSLLPEFTMLSSPLIVSALFITLFIIIFSAHNQKITRGSIFNTGIIAGFTILIFTPSLFFLIWVYVALAILRPFKLNEWLILLLGVLTPYYFFTIILYLNDSFSWKYFYNGLSASVRSEKYTIWHAGGLFLVLMPFLAGIYYTQSLSGRMLIHVRKAWNLFIIYTAVCFGITFFNVGGGIENWTLVLMPIAAFHGFGYFNAELKLYPKIVFWITVIFVIAAQIFSGLW